MLILEMLKFASVPVACMLTVVVLLEVSIRFTDWRRKKRTQAALRYSECR